MSVYCKQKEIIDDTYPHLERTEHNIIDDLMQRQKTTEVLKMLLGMHERNYCS